MSEVNETNNQAVPVADAAPIADAKPQETAQEETPEQINWRKFRQKRAEERKALEEAQSKNVKQAEEISALKAAIEAVVNKPAREEEKEQPEETEDNRLKRYVQEAIEAAEKKRAENNAVREQQELPTKLANTFSDFNNVCTHENLDYLEYHYPEVAKAFQHMPDSFEKWANVYKAIKRFIPNADNVKDQKRAEKNALKPQSMNSAGMTIGGDNAPIMMDDKRRADNWSRMQKIMRGIK